jgi:hypothetical protein
MYTILTVTFYELNVKKFNLAADQPSNAILLKLLTSQRQNVNRLRWIEAPIAALKALNLRVHSHPEICS